MKLQDWLSEKRWNTAIFSRESGISLSTLRKIINGDGGICLDVALRIEKSTEGKVKSWDLSPNAELIKKGHWPLRNAKPKNKNKKHEEKEYDCKECDIENI